MSEQDAARSRQRNRLYLLTGALCLLLVLIALSNRSARYSPVDVSAMSQKRMVHGGSASAGAYEVEVGRTGAPGAVASLGYVKGKAEAPAQAATPPAPSASPTRGWTESWTRSPRWASC
jgi:hypothetical protein